MMRRYLCIFFTFIISLLYARAEKTFTVVIDPGHGGRDPGCIGAKSKEKDINLSVALKLGELIDAAHKDVKVLYTRKADVFIALDERANIANKNKADLFISIHTNSIKKGTASGTETYTMGLANSDENLEVAMRENSVILLEENYLQKYEGFDPNSTESYIMFEFMQSVQLDQSVQLASEIQKSFVKVQRTDRGVRQANLLVLRRTSMPSVLIELGFISDSNEERYMTSKEGQETLARAICKAFTNYKKEVDRKSVVLADITPSEPAPPPPLPKEPDKGKDTTKTPPPPRETPSKQETPAGSQDAGKDAVIYKVQILTSDKELQTNDKLFKGYSDIGYYREGRVYKYTYGSTTNYQEILTMQRKARADFPDAFIISMKNGKRITP